MPRRQNSHTSSGEGGGSISGESRMFAWTAVFMVCRMKPAVRLAQQSCFGT